MNTSINLRLCVWFGWDAVYAICAYMLHEPKCWLAADPAGHVTWQPPTDWLAESPDWDVPSCSPCSTSSIYYRYTNSLWLPQTLAFSVTSGDRRHVFIICSILRQLNPMNLGTLEKRHSQEKAAGSTCLLWTSCHLANQTGERPDALVTLCFQFPQTHGGAETLKPLGSWYPASRNRSPLWGRGWSWCTQVVCALGVDWSYRAPSIIQHFAIIGIGVYFVWLPI